MHFGRCFCRNQKRRRSLFHSPPSARGGKRISRAKPLPRGCGTLCRFAALRYSTCKNSAEAVDSPACCSTYSRRDKHDTHIADRREREHAEKDSRYEPQAAYKSENDSLVSGARTACWGLRARCQPVALIPRPPAIKNRKIFSPVSIPAIVIRLTNEPRYSCLHPMGGGAEEEEVNISVAYNLA